MAANSDVPQQRSAALAQVPDPPGETLLKVLPYILGDGPELVAALRAAYKGLVFHAQNNLPALRGIETALSAEQQRVAGRKRRRCTVKSVSSMHHAAVNEPDGFWHDRRKHSHFHGIRS